jgi:uncharacterized membrane protein YphA (DoxX/SURF4 family)
MFPVGAAGYGLLILRLCAAGMLMHDAMSETTGFTTWESIGAAVLGIFLCLGAFTPVSCVASSVALIAIGWNQVDRDPYQLAFSLSVTATLFLIGPGAFSIDSRLFGRRLILRSK